MEEMRTGRAQSGKRCCGTSLRFPESRRRASRHAAAGFASKLVAVSEGAVFFKDQEHGVSPYLVTPGYLEAMGMHLRAGRDFNWQDTPKNEPVIIQPGRRTPRVARPGSDWTPGRWE